MKPLYFYLMNWLVLLLLILNLTGCAKSVRKVSSATMDEAGLHHIADKGNTSSQMAQKTPEELLSSGFVYLSRKNFTLANMHFVMALQKEPDLALAYVGLGRIDQEQGSFDGAQSKYKQALKLHPGLLPAHIGLAQAMRLDGRLNDAIASVNQAMLLAPEDIRVLSELAIIYGMMGKETLAEPLFKEIVERTPDQATGYNNLGMNYLLKKQYAEAIVEFEQALMINKQYELVRNNLATAFLLYGDKDTALEIFKETVGEAAAYNNIGYLLLTQGHLDEAENALMTALKINPRFYSKAQENLDRVQQMRKRQRSQ